MIFEKAVFLKYIKPTAVVLSNAPTPAVVIVTTIIWGNSADRVHEAEKHGIIIAQNQLHAVHEVMINPKDWSNDFQSKFIMN